MKKTILIILLAISTSTNHAKYKEIKSYIQFNPTFKLGKYDNSNYFLDAQFFCANYQVNRYLSFSGDASVGFTADRAGSFMNMNHYMNKLTFRTTYRPNGIVGLFAEANFSNIIDGSSAPVTYFRTGNYQAVGISFDFLEITKYEK